jgi:hypothetical protein
MAVQLSGGQRWKERSQYYTLTKLISVCVNSPYAKILPCVIMTNISLQTWYTENSTAQSVHDSCAK